MATTEKSPAVACTLGGGDLAVQAERWLELRRGAQRARQETEDGLRVTFDDAPDAEAELRALVAVERDCCSWASWNVFREKGTLVLQATSTDHGVEALHGMFR
jgi:hypothetical protein